MPVAIEFDEDDDDDDDDQEFKDEIIKELKNSLGFYKTLSYFLLFVIFLIMVSIVLVDNFGEIF